MPGELYPVDWAVVVELEIAAFQTAIVAAAVVGFEG